MRTLILQDIYISLKKETNNNRFENYIGNNFENKYKTNSMVSGILKKNYHDVKKRKVGRTFRFDAIINEGILIKVRNCQFHSTI